MQPLLTIVPSRSRPANGKRLLQSWRENDCKESQLVFLMDDDDPTVVQYQAFGASVETAPRQRIGPRLNEKAVAVANEYRVIGFMGDDHLPRTHQWDTIICKQLKEMGTGIVYGDDLLQGEMIPTAVFMTSDIVRALGYFCPPVLQHMYLDNAWKDWGQGANCLRYLPDVIIEHMHPGSGKAAQDNLYAESGVLMGPDGERYREYVATSLADDVEKIMAI